MPITSSKLAVSFFLTNQTDYIEWIIEAVASLDYPDMWAVKAVSSASKLFKRVHKKFNDFCDKNKINEPDKNCVELWDKIESKGIYEFDSISHLISDSIIKWKKSNPEKRLVLLIEDLDRIDPSHLFRILNILSAHIDYSYKYGVKVDYNTVEGNKFGVDNIVCVLDYNNLISIFRHFYGEYTSWEGYISKFSTKGYFSFSLSKEKCKYYYSKASSLCGISTEMIRLLIKEEVVKNTSMRVLNSSIDKLDSQFKPIKDYCKKRITKCYPNNLLKFFVLARRFGKKDKEIIEIVDSVIRNSSDIKSSNIKSLIMPYYFLMTDSELSVISFGEKDKNGYLIQYDFTQNNNETSFKGEMSLLSGYIKDESYTKYRDVINFMLTLVGR